MSEIIIKCKYEKLIPISEWRDSPYQTNKHPPDQIKRLAKIIKYQGIRRPATVSTLSGCGVTGHGLVEAIKQNGGKVVPVDYQDFDDEDMERAHVTSDNSIAAWADIDLGLVNAQIGEFDPGFDIDLLGIKDFELEPADKFHGDEDAVPEAPPEPVVKRGELWLLGNHRLLIDDCTVKENVERLLAGEKADMVFTDPPYGMKAVENSGVLKDRYRAIVGDDSPDLAKQVFKSHSEIPGIWWGANYYCSVLPDASKWLVWDKNNGGSDQTDCELAWTNLSGVVRQFTIASEKVNRVHPTQKPVALIEWAFGFQDGSNVFDPFLGSGSTLIACEKTNRKCFGMEIDPHYGAVIIERWQKFTGREAVREDGIKYAELVNG